MDTEEPCLIGHLSNEWYAKDISRKIRLMYQSRAAMGIPIGQPIYGYTKELGKPTRWVIDSQAATNVRSIYQLSFRGYGTAQIAAELEKAKTYTPSSYRCLNSGNG